MLRPHEIAALMILADAPSPFRSEHVELHQLVDDGLVVVETDPIARSTHVRLSEQGRKLVQRLTSARRQA